MRQGNSDGMVSACFQNGRGHKWRQDVSETWGPARTMYVSIEEAKMTRDTGVGVEKRVLRRRLDATTPLAAPVLMDALHADVISE